LASLPLKSISVFPNPAINEMTLDFNSPTALKQIILFDLNGKVVDVFNMETEEHGEFYSLSLDHLEPGVYILNAQDVNGVIFQKQVIKQY